MTSFDRICRSRFSVRDFEDKRVEQEAVATVLEAMRLAPTALNHQPYRVIVAESDAALSKLSDEAKATLYGAKTVLILCSESDNHWSNRYNGEDHTLLDIGIVTATALYAATAANIDSCCVCNFDPMALHRAFSLSEALCPEALILLGYRSGAAQPSPRHELRRAVSDFTEWR